MAFLRMAFPTGGTLDANAIPSVEGDNVTSAGRGPPIVLLAALTSIRMPSLVLPRFKTPVASVPMKLPAMVLEMVPLPCKRMPVAFPETTFASAASVEPSAFVPMRFPELPLLRMIPAQSLPRTVDPSRQADIVPLYERVIGVA